MIAPESNHTPGPHDRPPIEHDGARSRESVAAEYVVQGLLEYMHRDDAASREKRVARVVAAIEADTRPIPITTARGFPRTLRWAIASAAVLALCVGLLILGVPGETSAQAEMNQTIAAMRSAGARRYEIRMSQSHGAGKSPDAIVDSVPGKLLIRHTPPWNRGTVVFAGRDETGPWTISDGKVNRENAEAYWPPYITDGGEAFMLSAVDKQLDELPKSFSFARLDAGGIEGGTTNYDRISASRIGRAGPMPTRVELWIDPSTHLIERVEYHWDSGNTDSSRVMSQHRGPGKPDHGTHDGPPDAMTGHDGAPPHHDHDRGGPGHGPDGSPPPPNHENGPGDMHDHSPRDAGGPRGGPRVIVFQRVDAPPFPSDWFTPESHLQPEKP